MTSSTTGPSDIALSSASLPVVARSAFSTSDSALLALLQGSASWIWFPEDQTTAPIAPTNEQRAFRKAYAYPKDKGTPTNATIMVVADDYFAMYVDGVLAHAADPQGRDWNTIEVFNVPLPVTRTSATPAKPGDAMLLGFRVINELNTAGLLVAVQINFDSGASDLFFTGLDQTWLSERLIQENWEQPWFDVTPQGKTRWAPATVFSKAMRDASQEGLTLPNREIVVLGQLTVDANGTGNSGVAAGDNAPTPGPDSSRGVACGGGRAGVTLSTGAFAGTIVGTVVLSLILGALIAILVMKRRHSSKSKDGGDPQYMAQYGGSPAETTPGRSLYGPL